MQVGTEAVVTAADDRTQTSWCKAGSVKVFKTVRLTQSIRWVHGGSNWGQMADVEKVGGSGEKNVKSISCGAMQPKEHSKSKEEAK